MPDHDRTALASNGGFSIVDYGVAKYKSYVDQIAAATVSKSRNTLKHIPRVTALGNPFAEHSTVGIGALIESNRLAKLATERLHVHRCRTSRLAGTTC